MFFYATAAKHVMRLWWGRHSQPKNPVNILLPKTNKNCILTFARKGKKMHWTNEQLAN